MNTVVMWSVRSHRDHHFFVVLNNKKAQICAMTTATRLSGLGGWLGRSLSVMIACAFCASAYADPSKNVVELSKVQPIKKTAHKVCYTYISNSGIPQPCDRLGAIPTTSSPMIIIGVNPAGQERR
jgi:hypothetical protein